MYLHTSGCTPRAHLTLIYIFAPAPVKSAPRGVHQECTTGAHQQCTNKCTITGANQKCTYPSCLHLHQKHTYHCINVWTIQMIAYLTKHLQEWMSEWLNLTAFLGTANSKVHIVHISHVIVAYILESLSSLTKKTHNLQATINFKKKDIKNET